MSDKQKWIFDKLFFHIGEVVPYKELFIGWDDKKIVENTQLLRVQINRLRQVMPPNYCIFAKRGEGYMMYEMKNNL